MLGQGLYPDKLDCTLEAFDRIGIFTLELLQMVVSWRRSQIQMMTASIPAEVRSVVQNALDVPHGKFSSIVKNGMLRKEAENVGERYLSIGMPSALLCHFIS